MSFELANVPTHFMYHMNSFFMLEFDKSAVVFIDDILLYLKSVKNTFVSCFNICECTSCTPNLASVSSRSTKCHS
jgi:hypothetical protein